MNVDNTRCLANKKGKTPTQCSRTKRPDSNYCCIHAKIHEKEVLIDKKKQMELNMARCRKYGLLRYVDHDRFMFLNYEYILKHFDATIAYCRENILKLIIVQRIARKFLGNLILKLHGPAWKQPQLCNNTTDFYSLDDLRKIPDNLFFSFLDEKDGFIYGFHIESFINYIEQNTTMDNELVNPYNRNQIAKRVIHNANQLWQHLIDRNEDTHEVNLDEENEEDDEARCRSKAVRYMQKLDLLGYQTNVDWILDSDINALNLIYINMLQYWLFRAGLNEEAQRNIVPFNDPFSQEAIEEIRDSDDVFYVMEELLDVINMLVSSAYEEDNRRIGCIIVLLALADIIPQVSEFNPWLA
jgi:hypothetical protein